MVFGVWLKCSSSIVPDQTMSVGGSPWATSTTRPLHHCHYLIMSKSVRLCSAFQPGFRSSFSPSGRAVTLSFFYIVGKWEIYFKLFRICLMCNCSKGFCLHSHHHHLPKERRLLGGWVGRCSCWSWMVIAFYLLFHCAFFVLGSHKKLNQPF